MSQAHENIDVPNPGPIAGDHHPPRSVQNQELRGTSDFVDGSGHIFSMYLGMATEEDKKMAKNWKDDADGILIFTGLFSAAVASLISVSIQDIRQNPQDTSNFYLSNIYRTVIDPNISSSLPASPPPFSPPNYAIWVNALWFLSLVISITCALLATLLQRWARRYLKVTQPHYSPQKQARIRSFFAEGVDKFLLSWAVEALPMMLHVSLSLFFAGLAVFSWNINLTIFKLVLSWVGLCTALYGCITFIPVFRHDSPYHTPLSLPAWHFVTGIQFLKFRALQRLVRLCCFSRATYHRFRHLAEGYRESLAQGMWKAAEDSAFKSPPEIDTRAFLWTFDRLDEDHELEDFFSGLPGFRSSKVVKDPLPSLTPEQQGKLLDALIGLLDRTSSSDLLPESAKIRTAVICGKAIRPADVPQTIQRVLSRIVSEDQYGPVQSAEIARFVRGWDNGRGRYTTTTIRAIVSSVVARAQRHDDLWFDMAADEIGVEESVLRNHATHGNNLSLAILIYLVRKQFSLFRERYWPQYEFSKVLEEASKFDVLDTSPELQHEFCALWNQVRSTDNFIIPWNILRPIRNIYLALHLHTDSAPTAFSASTGDEDRILLPVSTYPPCNIPGHHSASTPRIHDVSTSIAVSQAVLHNNATLVPSSLVSAPDAPSSSLTTPIHIDDKLDNMLVPAPSSYAHQTATENFHGSATSPDPAAAASTQASTSARTMPPTTHETTSTSTSSVPPPATLSHQNNADIVHSDALDVLSSASSEPVLDGHSTATISAGVSPWPTSAPQLDIAEGNTKAGPREDKGTIDPLSVTRINQSSTTAVLGHPPLPPPRPLATDVTIAGLSE